MFRSFQPPQNTKNHTPEKTEWHRLNNACIESSSSCPRGPLGRAAASAVATGLRQSWRWSVGATRHMSSLGCWVRLHTPLRWLMFMVQVNEVTMRACVSFGTDFNNHSWFFWFQTYSFISVVVCVLFVLCSGSLDRFQVRLLVQPNEVRFHNWVTSKEKYNTQKLII